MSDLINRQAAIDALARMMPRSYTPDGSHPADEEIFRAQEIFADCIEALEILPSAQPATNCSEISNGSDDTISRRAAIDQLHQSYNLLDAERRMEDLPSAQPEPYKDTLGVNLHVVKISKHCSDFSDFDNVKECEDAVSRQAAINTMYELMGHWFGADSEDEKREIKREFDKLPPAQPEQRWIPVTERLPEDEYVLISKKPTKILGDKWSVDIAIRTADPRSGKIQWRDSGFGVIQDDKVLAWMPLPERYLGE